MENQSQFNFWNVMFFGDLDLQTNKTIMAVWLLTALFWINKKSDEEVE